MSGREPDRREPPRRDADGIRNVLREELGDMLAQQGRGPPPPPPPPGYPPVAGQPIHQFPQYPAGTPNLAAALPPAPQQQQAQRRFCFNCSKHGVYAEDHLAPQCPRPRVAAASRFAANANAHSAQNSPAASSPVTLAPEDAELQAKIVALTEQHRAEKEAADDVRKAKVMMTMLGASGWTLPAAAPIQSPAAPAAAAAAPTSGNSADSAAVAVQELKELKSAVISLAQSLTTQNQQIRELQTQRTVPPQSAPSQPAGGLNSPAAAAAAAATSTATAAEASAVPSKTSMKRNIETMLGKATLTQGKFKQKVKSFVEAASITYNNNPDEALQAYVDKMFTADPAAPDVDLSGQPNSA